MGGKERSCGLRGGNWNLKFYGRCTRRVAEMERRSLEVGKQRSRDVRVGASLVAQWLRSACQCRGHGFDPWSRKIPHAMEQLSL